MSFLGKDLRIISNCTRSLINLLRYKQILQNLENFYQNFSIPCFTLDPLSLLRNYNPSPSPSHLSPTFRCPTSTLLNILERRTKDLLHTFTHSLLPPTKHTVINIRSTCPSLSIQRMVRNPPTQQRNVTSLGRRPRSCSSSSIINLRRSLENGPSVRPTHQHCSPSRCPSSSRPSQRRRRCRGWTAAPGRASSSGQDNNFHLNGGGGEKC